eukprot:12577934-Heterocapsa_arctica.AAC.1
MSVRSCFQYWILDLERYYWILDCRLGIALSQIEDEVHFDSLFTALGARRATRGPLLTTIYSVWRQESAPE